MITHKLAGEQPKKENILYWRVVLDDRLVYLQASKDGRDWWYVVSIDENGMMERAASVPKSLGLPLTKMGCITDIAPGND